MGLSDIVRAAGGIVTRRSPSGELEVLLVYRGHRNDWTFPKGKADPGETDEACALREVEEETSLRCALEEEVASVSYRDRKGRLKVVRYWMMRPVGGVAEPRNEIDAVRWASMESAARLLSYDRDRALLEALAQRLSTWPATSSTSEARASLMKRERVLFVCTHNSARSQMAEGFLRARAGHRFEVASAGSEATRVHPLAIRAMAEAGIDISGHRSKTLDAFLRERWDHVITVCDSANERCPVFPGAATRLHWSFDDPSGASGREEERLAVFRRVRDEIASRLQSWLGEPPAG